MDVERRVWRQTCDSPKIDLLPGWWRQGYRIRNHGSGCGIPSWCWDCDASSQRPTAVHCRWTCTTALCWPPSVGTFAVARPNAESGTKCHWFRCSGPCECWWWTAAVGLPVLCWSGGCRRSRSRSSRSKLALRRRGWSRRLSFDAFDACVAPTFCWQYCLHLCLKTTNTQLKHWPLSVIK